MVAAKYGDGCCVIVCDMECCVHEVVAFCFVAAVMTLEDIGSLNVVSRVVLNASS